MKRRGKSFFLKFQVVIISLLGLFALGLSWALKYIVLAIERGLSTCWFCG